jgi:hypothetical protein
LKQGIKTHFFAVLLLGSTYLSMSACVGLLHREKKAYERGKESSLLAGRKESWRQKRRQQKSLGFQQYIFLKFMNLLFIPKLLATNVANSL